MKATGPAIQSPPHLPHGVQVVEFRTHEDDRGSFTEVFREEWGTGVHPVQWNVVHSHAGVLRGVHVHRTHADYLMVVAGSMILALHDIRPDSPTHGTSATVALTASPLRAVSIPPGVCHGFWFPEPSTHLYAVSHYWNLADEFGCHWTAPELGLDWTVTDPQLSERDRTAGDYESMVAAWRSAGDASEEGGR